MDKLNRYRQIIQKTLTEYQQWASEANVVEVQQNISFDQERDQYLWFHVG